MGAQPLPRALACKQPALLVGGVALAVLAITIIAGQVRHGPLPLAVKAGGETKRQGRAPPSRTDHPLPTPAADGCPLLAIDAYSSCMPFPAASLCGDAQRGSNRGDPPAHGAHRLAPQRQRCAAGK